MTSPPLLPLQGASRTTGATFRGRAPGNALNYADFSHEDDGMFTVVKPRLSFKIHVHVEYGDVVTLNKVPDFTVQRPLTVFLQTGTSVPAQSVLIRAAQFHNAVLGKNIINQLN